MSASAADSEAATRASTPLSLRTVITMPVSKVRTGSSAHSTAKKRSLSLLRNDKGVLARVAATLADAEADITHVEMADETPQDSTDLRFVIAVRDRTHLDAVLRAARRTASVLTAARTIPAP